MTEFTDENGILTATRMCPEKRIYHVPSERPQLSAYHMSKTYFRLHHSSHLFARFGWRRRDLK